MRKREVAGAVFTFLVLVELPLVAIRLIPAQTLSQLSAMGLNVPGLVMQTALIGLVIYVITLVKAITNKKSIAYLILDVSLNMVSLIFALLVVGVGNISSLGYSNFRLTQGKVTTEILLNFRLFIWLTVGVVTLSVLRSVAMFREVRSEKTANNPLNTTTN
jgi:hypothetical protein